MRILNMKSAALALSAILFATSFTPSQAFTTIPVPTPADRAGIVENVQYRDRDWRRYERREMRRIDRRRDRAVYWNGHRGYRDYRPGYRRHNGAWFPLAAFATGAIIGGAIASQPAAGGSHVQWCANRYRSYRVSDNTYQPNAGPRRACVSPY